MCGASQCDDATAAVGEAVGRLLAQRGATVICGGLGGVMEAAARGAFTAGGVVVGLLPGLEVEQGNPYLSVAIATGASHARNLYIVASSDAVIAIGGEYGTLSEIALALKLGKPVIGLNTWTCIRNGRPAAVHAVETPEEAVERALAEADRRASQPG